MLKFVNTGVVFQEIPDEVTLAINISNCPCHCPGCHSKYLWQDIGEPLTPFAIDRFIKEFGGDITCICFMGGDSEPEYVGKLARYIHKAQKMGYAVGVISWLSKCGSPSYDEAVTAAKREWLAKHLPSVEWDEIHIVKYGTPKSTCRTYSGILFDDEQRNLDEWGEGAVIACDMLEVLRNLSM